VTAVEARLAALFDHLSLARVHLAGRASIDWLGFASAHPERIASLMLLCPQVLEPAALLPLGARVLVVAGDEGRGAARVRAALRLLPEATARILPGYTGLSWSDLAGDRGDAIGPAIEDFIDRADPLPAAVGLKVIEIILRDRLAERAAQLGERLKAGLLVLQQRYDCIGDVRGRGLLLGLDLVKDRRTRAPDPDLAQRVARECLELGMMTSVVRGGFGIFRIAPPITIDAREIDLGLEIFDRALAKAVH